MCQTHDKDGVHVQEGRKRKSLDHKIRMALEFTYTDLMIGFRQWTYKLAITFVYLTFINEICQDNFPKDPATHFYVESIIQEVMILPLKCIQQSHLVAGHQLQGCKACILLHMGCHLGQNCPGKICPTYTWDSHT